MPIPRTIPANIVKIRAGMSDSPARKRTKLVNFNPKPVRLITPMTIPAQAQAAATPRHFWRSPQVL